MIYSNGSPEEEGTAALVILKSVGFEWSVEGVLLKAPDTSVCIVIHLLHYKDHPHLHVVVEISTQSGP